MTTRTERALAVRVFALVAGLLPMLAAGCSQAQAPPQHDLLVHKTATCNCCLKWTDHLAANGLSSKVELENDIRAVQKRLGVPEHLYSCHVAVAGDYLIVGHVPAEDIRRLLAEKPAAKGLVVPGMPLGSPGMEHGELRQRYEVLLFQADGSTAVYARH